MVHDLVVINRKKEAVTSSRTLAEVFGKRHGTILRKIETLKKEDRETFNELKIVSVKYTDTKGEKRKQFMLNRDAYAFFAMGFTGKNANRFKIAFIQAFNDMESFIKDRLQSSIEFKAMAEMLYQYRDVNGKKTMSHHYSNEARLVNWVLTGGFNGLKRNSLSPDEIALLNRVQARNAVLIGSGMQYKQRKEALLVFAELQELSSSHDANQQLPESR